ncbi:type I site-specific deoxyribonuclease, HsdR family [Nitrosococcus halophilus Nc 4]|uniref:Type I restriction enzyme endonuclease subunit n=1 Tax=Nitrosococcus halophilus (strain Nc4) TaxID=472759 RepID=D5C3X3_NITHN|nr:HsdR family type I site-specific deoxyribonuclease [Nitrosococcus halophilus]ADE15095.1 type I site-specific deoxyribonuclease, HsdR family [Nitrosococcus halophilus Nc 4]
MPSFLSEDNIEQAMVQRLQHLYGYDVLDCYTSDAADLNDGSQRADKREVILRDRLKAAAVRLNPEIPEAAIDDAVDQVCDRRQAMATMVANRELDSLIRDGVRVEFKDKQNNHGRTRKERIKLIDFDTPENNHFLAATQLWIQSTGAAAKAGYRRPDILLYINGLPLVFIELKNSNVKLRSAYDDNLTHYKADIPQLFLTNVFCVFSNGLETRLGSLSAEWEHFFHWLRPEDEKEKIRRDQIREQGTSAERFLQGLAAKDKLLDYVENFVIYHKGSQKIIAQNHQFLGVNRAFRVFVERRGWLEQQKGLADKEPLTPALSQGEREKTGAHYRAGYDFSGLVTRARELRQQQTPAEDVLWQLLRNRQFLGLKFRRQHQLGDFIADFYCDEHKLVVEVDGSIHATVEKTQHDRTRQLILEGQGFQVIQLSNELILNNPEAALESIAAKLPLPDESAADERTTPNKPQPQNRPSPSGRGAGGEGKTPFKANRLGVFWHTQGSGKSFSMIFYARKIIRKVPGNYSFVVVTDREDLDGQIYRNFLNTETVKKADAAQPKNSEQMRAFLGQNKKLVFTLIQKFRWPKGKRYPVLSERDDIIVIVDEAHRTQYKSLAENMRAGLPHAQYLAFTGTPLLGRERKTNEWFGDYVSEYNFSQSMDDGATVPLFYKKRVPEVLNQNEELSDEFYEILEDENLDEAQQEKLERRFATELQVIKRDDRLETIARDLVYHFPRRGYLGKGMLIAVDKFTAVKMYDKVQRLWKEDIKSLRGEIKKSVDEVHKARLQRQLDWMRKVEMAVVVSAENGEEEKFDAQGLDIRPHRKRMDQLDAHGHDLEYNYKDPEHPLQLVFVCAMWLTGFDAPTVSTLYLDKPQKDHTLMQTIARANRVSSHRINGVEKTNGEIVDYYGVIGRLRKAIKDYGQGGDGLDEPPVKDKDELFCLLADALEQARLFCAEREIVIDTALAADDVFKQVSLFEEWADTLLSKDEWRQSFKVLENTITALYEACKPEILGDPVVRKVALFQYLRGVLDSIIQQQDIDLATKKINELLDESLIVDDQKFSQVKEESGGWKIEQKGQTWDLSKIDFDKLKEDFKQAKYKNIEIADLRAFLEKKLQDMLNKNRTRRDFAERLQEIIDNYNAGSNSADSDFTELVKFAESLKQEEDRHIREGLSEDELEIYDLLCKENMTKAEEKKVRLAARALLKRLTEEKPKVLVQDWYKDSQTRLAVRDEVGAVLDEYLPEDSYDKELFLLKRDRVFELTLDLAINHQRWAA